VNEKKRSGRYSLITGLVFALLFAVVIQVIRVQASPDYVEKFRDIGAAYSVEVRTVTPARGQIFDRWGNLMAGNRTVYEVGAELYYVKNPQTIAQTLDAVMDIDYTEVYSAASLEFSDTAVYTPLVDNVSRTDYEKLVVLKKQIDQAFKDGF